MKKKFKGISLILVILLVTTFISVKTSASDVPTQPNFTIQNLKATPDTAKVNEDIVVTGRIVPEDFETTIQPKEIVLVLDTSGSMDNPITLEEPCTEVRVNKYCTTHNSSIINHSGSNHKWVDDYCVTHKKSGEHNKVINSTKIEELKKAAKSFIETMKSVPNLKIGIVAYSTEATINPYDYNIGKKTVQSLDSNTAYEVQNYKSYNSNLLDKNDKVLGQIIDNIKPLGGTNTGEGLRKAIYVLNNGDKSASKTIVLMSDGEPTYYSTYSNKSFYKEIDNNYPKVAGTGSSTNSKTEEYSNLIASIVKDNGYNAYSIGYGLSSNGTKYFRQIHSSMKGLNSSTEANEDNGFFAKSDGSITEIFNQVAENIKDSYPINNVALNITFKDGFILNVGGNTVNIGSVTYKKVSETNGKVRYQAEPVNFSFIIKANKLGYQSIFEKLNLSYMWQDKTITKDTKEEVNVTINSNELPVIGAKLLSSKEITVNPNEEITIKYEINPEDFQFNDTNNAIEKDIAIVIDTSMDMKDNISIVKNALFNKLLNNSTLKNTKTNYALITFSNKSQVVSDLNNNSTNPYTDYNKYITDLNDKYLKNITAEQQSPNAKNIDETFSDIIKVLDKGRSGAGKNVIFISTEKVSYNAKNLNDLKAKGYNIITLSVENDKNNANLKNLHKDLNGLDENYFFISDPNSIENSVMGKVADKLIAGTKYKPYIFKPVINLNLGSNFEAIEGISPSSENRSIGVLEVPTITYNLTQGNNYHGDGKVVEVKLRVNNLKPGTYGFGTGSENIMIYNSLIGAKVIYRLETPKIIIKEKVKDLVHGLYEGIENNHISIYSPLEGNKTMISPGATVTFGAKFIISNDDFELALNGDLKFKKIQPSDIKVYKLNKTTNSLVEIKTTAITDLGDNKFIIKASNLNNKSEDTELVVIYKGTIKENSEKESFINNVTISDLKSEVKIYTGSSSSEGNENEGDYQEVLPDLF